MTAIEPRMPTRIVGPPIHPMLVVAAACCFIGTLLTDLAYWRTANIAWSDFSTWLVSAGAILSVLAVLAAIFDHVGRRLAWTSSEPLYGIALLAATVIGIIDMLIHTHDAWTSVVPWGLGLSVLTVVVILFTGWMGRATVYHRDVVRV
jgi:uncharacterized membrane protein